jgi:hypothetical protein
MAGNYDVNAVIDGQQPGGAYDHDYSNVGIGEADPSNAQGGNEFRSNLSDDNTTDDVNNPPVSDADFAARSAIEGDANRTQTGKP